MPEAPRQRKDSRAFSALCEAILARGFDVRFRANGRSMQPNIYDDDAVIVTPPVAAGARRGQIAFTQGRDRFRMHRLVRETAGGSFITRGDAGIGVDPEAQVHLGNVISIERGRRKFAATGLRARLSQNLRKQSRRVAMAAQHRASIHVIGAIFISALLFLAAAAPASAQRVLTVGFTAPANNSAVAPLDTITYTVSLANNSGSTVNGASVSIPDPAFTTFSSAAKASGNNTWTCTNAGTPLTATCTTATGYANGNATTFTFVFTVNAGSAGNATLATVTAKGTNTTANATATVNVNIQAPVLTLTNTGAPNPVAPGINVAYTVGLSNSSGVNVIANETVTMADPAGMTYVSAVKASGTGTWTCGHAAGTITCTDTANYNDGSATTFTFTYTVNLGTSAGTISATANANAANTTSAGTATANITVQNPTFTVTNTPAPSPVAPGDTISYTVGISNASGVTAVANETVTMADPANTTYVSAVKASGSGTWTCVHAAGTITCTDTANYATATSTTFTFKYTVSAVVANGTVITSVANAQAANAVSSGTATANDTVQTPDISVANSANPTQATTGGTITYTQVITNNGTDEAVGASFTETTPANTTFNSATAPAGFTCGTLPSAGATGTITCTANAGTVIAAAGTATLTVVVNVNPGRTVAGSTISDTVTVSETGTETNLANNTATASSIVTGADLSMTQLVSSAALAPGSTISYTETVTNSGPNAATTVTLYQQTPVNTTFSSITIPTGWACGTLPTAGATGQIICSIATLASGTTSANFVINVTINSGTSAPAAGTTIQNYADVTSQTADPVVSNNATQTSVLVEISGNADIAITGGAAPTPVFVDSTLIYTFQVTNYGLAASTGSVLTDTLPASVTYVSATSSQGTCAQALGIVTCTIGAIAYAPTSPITVTITVSTPATAKTLSNTASVSSTSTDPVSTNNSATVITVVQPLVCATPGKDGSPSSAVTGIVNTYYPPGAGVGTVPAGTNSIVLGAASGATTPIASGDLLLFIQMQGATINTTATTINTGAYGDGVPGDPGSGSTSLGPSGQYEFVTATSSVPVAGGTLTFVGTGITLIGNTTSGLLNTYTEAVATSTQGQMTFQVIRVPQYATVTFGNGLTALAWTGSVGGVLGVDVSSQLTMSGTTTLDGLGFRGAGGRILGGGTGAGTDYVTLSTNNANGGKGEGIAGTPAYISPVQSSILLTTTATATAQTYVEGIPGGSYARGAPGNAGGGATDANPPQNNQNSGGGGGGNGGSGGNGGFGWSSAGIVGGFGGVSFPGSTSTLIMGGGGGAGTTNDGSYWNPLTVSGSADCGANCTGIYTSGTAGGGIAIIRAGSLVGTGTISANGLTALQVENDGGGGGGAGGSVLVFTNTGNISGLTINANGGSGGITWPEDTPGSPYPGNRHGPGGGGGGGIALLTGTPASLSLLGGDPGYSTLSDDAYGATPGQIGLFNTGLTITQTPGTQSGAYCAGADLAVTNTASPTIVVPGNNITYTQTVTNNGPYDALNAVFGEAIPANTTFQSIVVSGSGAANWTCTTVGSISCTNPDVPVGASGNTTFTVVTQVAPGTATGTQIIDTASITSGTNDPTLANNLATATVLVAAANTANLSITSAATPNPVTAGNSITYTIVVTNNGPATATNVNYSEIIPAAPGYATFSSLTCPASWTCTKPAVGGTGTITGSIASLASGGTATFTFVLATKGTTPSGTVISETANVSSSTTDPNPETNTATSNVVVAAAGQFDLSLTDSATPNPVLPGNNISYTQTLSNAGPSSASNVVFTGSVPANTTLVSFGIPAGWICPVLPTAGNTGSISCCPGTGITCSGAAVPSGTQLSFPMVVKVNSTVQPGGSPIAITNTISVAPTTNDVTTSNNTASSTVYVTSPTQADLSIVKTASPQPVDQGTNLTYTLQVTNNGPAIAQSVVVTDPLPTQVTYTSVSTTQGTCSQASGTVTCPLGSLSVGSNVTIIINVTAATFSSSTLATNTASVSSSTSDSDTANNSSSVTSTIEAPTAVQLSDFHATLAPQGGVIVEWHTKEEVRNLGFHLYRDDASGHHRLDPSLIAGSALELRGGQPQHAAKTYQWFDAEGDAQSSYSVEDVDLNGTRTMHGPVQSGEAANNAGPMPLAAVQVHRATLLTDMNRVVAANAASPNAFAASNVPANANTAAVSSADPSSPRFNSVRSRGSIVRQLGNSNSPASAEISTATLNGEPAIKISVSQEGWYRVTAAQINALHSGFGSNFLFAARNLQLYAEGVEQPILVNAQNSFSLGTNGSIEFYGTVNDTPFSGTRVYWLVNGSRPGLRISPVSSNTTQTDGPSSFPAATTLEQRTTYFAALLNGEDKDNFFGALITSEPVDQTLIAQHADSSSGLPISVDITLQGGTDQQQHSVSVAFNGSYVGEIDFANQSNVTQSFALNNSQLMEGANAFTLTALNGDNDVSLVQSITLHYPHTYTSDSNWLEASAPASTAVHITGFTNSSVAVYDITNPLAIQQLLGRVSLDAKGYGITIRTPGGSSDRTLVALSADQIAAPDSLAYHAPSNLAQPQVGASYVVIAHPDFSASVAPLVSLHESEGQRSLVVTTDQIYDAFNYGERSPFAIRDFLQFASTRWRLTPQAVLLMGDASLDPRNYLGMGELDFVPSRMIETQAFKTASDDWLTDFNSTGFATIPTGRIPADTPDEATLAISKIVNFERGATAGSWQQQAAFIADQNTGDDFSAAAQTASTLAPHSLNVTKILTDGEDPSIATQQIVGVINNGALLIDYSGHGAEDQWSFNDVFDSSTVAGLTNGDRQPIFLLMDCLNGFFQDVYSQSLAEQLLFQPNGGAVSVWASSGFTVEPPQATMNQTLLGTLAANPSMPLGQAILQAKKGITDDDVRRTWTLFGDPAMKLPLKK